MNLTCPVCGAQGSIVEGSYVSLLTGERRTKNASELIGQLGKPGPWFAFTIESDWLSWPCGGYMLFSDGSAPRHLTPEELAE